MVGRNVEIVLALLSGALALLAIFVWIPMDSETPTIYTFRRQTFIGDAMLPTIAAAGIALFAVLHLIVTLVSRPSKQADPPFDALTLGFFGSLIVIIAFSMLLMYWAGPVALFLFGPGGDEAATYRQMRATTPWKYTGYTLGGFTLVFGITSLIEGSLSARRVLSSLIAVGVLILVFDVPFDTLQLPPNGDF